MKVNITHIRYTDNKSLLIVSGEGQIIRKFTLFEVVCVEPVGGIPFNAIVLVEEVLSTDKDQLIYLVWGKYFFHHYFQVY